MVQAGTPIGYDDNMEANRKPDRAWTDEVRNAIADFVTSIGESSKQLSSAAEQFAGESLRLIEDLTTKAQSSAAMSSSMASAAKQAADEAKRVAEDVSRAAADVSEHARNASRQELDAMSGKAEQAVRAAEDLKAAVESRIQDALQRIELAVTSGQQAAGNIDQLRSQMEQRLQIMTERLDRGLSSSQEAAAAAQRAAEEAREQTARAGESEEHGKMSNAEQILARLEADYQLLTQLVQELHARITGMSQAPAAREMPAAPQYLAAAESAPSAPSTEMQPQSHYEAPSAPTEATPPPYQAPADPEPLAPFSETEPQSRDEKPSAAKEAATPWYEAPAVQEETVVPVPSAPNPDVLDDVEAAWTQAPAEAEPEAETAEQPGVSAASPPVMLGGRVQVQVSPVPDFDRLLSLDGALGRMSDIRNVTLADYAQEEVTFRVELSAPLSIEDFARRLTDAAGQQVEVVSANTENISLRLVA